MRHTAYSFIMKLLLSILFLHSIFPMYIYTANSLEMDKQKSSFGSFFVISHRTLAEIVIGLISILIIIQQSRNNKNSTLKSQMEQLKKDMKSNKVLTGEIAALTTKNDSLPKEVNSSNIENKLLQEKNQDLEEKNKALEITHTQLLSIIKEILSSLITDKNSQQILDSLENLANENLKEVQKSITSFLEIYNKEKAMLLSRKQIEEILELLDDIIVEKSDRECEAMKIKKKIEKLSRSNNLARMCVVELFSILPDQIFVDASQKQYTADELYLIFKNSQSEHTTEWLDSILKDYGTRYKQKIQKNNEKTKSLKNSVLDLTREIGTLKSSLNSREYDLQEAQENTEKWQKDYFEIKKILEEQNLKLRQQGILITQQNKRIRELINMNKAI